MPLSSTPNTQRAPLLHTVVLGEIATPSSIWISFDFPGSENETIVHTFRKQMSKRPLAKLGKLRVGQKLAFRDCNLWHRVQVLDVFQFLEGVRADVRGLDSGLVYKCVLAQKCLYPLPDPTDRWPAQAVELRLPDLRPVGLSLPLAWVCNVRQTLRSTWTEGSTRTVIGLLSKATSVRARLDLLDTDPKNGKRVAYGNLYLQFTKPRHLRWLEKEFPELLNLNRGGKIDLRQYLLDAGHAVMIPEVKPKRGHEVKSKRLTPKVTLLETPAVDIGEDAGSPFFTPCRRRSQTKESKKSREVCNRLERLKLQSDQRKDENQRIKMKLKLEAGASVV